MTQRNRYQALLTVIREIHLSDGSTIMNTCHITSGAHGASDKTHGSEVTSVLSLYNYSHFVLVFFSPEGLVEIAGSHPDGMRAQILTQMRSKALNRLQSYWLPQYLRACKAVISTLKECSSVDKMYDNVASGLLLQKTQE